MMDNKALFAAVLLGVLLASPVIAEKLSGYAFVKDETRAMQDDDFANPGLLAMEKGAALFNTPFRPGGRDLRRMSRRGR